VRHYFHVQVGTIGQFRSSMQIGMTKKLCPVRDHIRLMESRIEQQTTEIERLKRLGQDASDGERRLGLLRRALEEVRIQLSRLSPTDLDAKGTDIDAAMKVLPGTGKS
jgi:hypothetical protein